jgi:hypothetical protein
MVRNKEKSRKFAEENPAKVGIYLGQDDISYIKNITPKYAFWQGQRGLTLQR